MRLLWLLEPLSLQGDSVAGKKKTWLMFICKICSVTYIGPEGVTLPKKLNGGRGVMGGVF